MKKAKFIYLTSLIAGYFLFIFFGMISKFFMSGTDSSGQVFVLLLIGGILFLPVFAIANMPIFFINKPEKRRGLTFFIPVVLISLITFACIQLKLMDSFAWSFIIPAQIIISAGGYFTAKI